MKKTKISIKTIKALTAAILLLNATHIVNNKLTITQAMDDLQNEVSIASKPTKLVNYYNEVKNLHMEELDHNHQDSKAFGILHTLRKHKYEDYEIFLYAARLQILPKILKDNSDNEIVRELNNDLITASQEQAKYDNLKNVMRNNPWIFLTLDKKDTSYEKLTQQEYETIRYIFKEHFTQEEFKKEIEKIKNSNNKGQVIEALDKIYKVLMTLKLDLLYSPQQEARQKMAGEISKRLTGIKEAIVILNSKNENSKTEEPNPNNTDNNVNTQPDNSQDLNKLHENAEQNQKLVFQNKNKITDIEAQLAGINKQLSTLQSTTTEKQEKLQEQIKKSNLLHTTKIDRLEQKATNILQYNQALQNTILVIYKALKAKQTITLDQTTQEQLAGPIKLAKAGKKALDDEKNLKKYTDDVTKLITDINNLQISKQN